MVADWLDHLGHSSDHCLDRSRHNGFEYPCPLRQLGRTLSKSFPTTVG